MGQHRKRLPGLDDPAMAHDADMVCERGDDGEVVADPDQRRAELRDQLLHLGQNLGLHGDIERGGRLVADDQFRPVQQGDRDGDALAHATGELVRIEIDLGFGIGDADLRQGGDGAAARLGTGDRLMRFQGEPDLRADGQHRVQRHHRVLEDHRDLLAADFSQFGGGETDEFAPFQLDRGACFDAAGRIDQADDREAGDALARAGFADEAHHLAALQREGDAVDRLHHAGAGVEIGRKVGDFEERRVAHRFSLGLT